MIALGDGRTLAATGLTETLGSLHNQTLETYNPITNKWELHNFPQGFPNLPLYAHLFLLENGRVFFDGGHMDDVLSLEPSVIDLTHEPLQTTPIFGINARDMRNQSASVILPPAQDQRIMLMGGGPDGKQNKTDAVDNVDIVDFKAAQPRFVASAPLNLPRLHLNAVLLPDRTVFVTGGSLKQEICRWHGYNRKFMIRRRMSGRSRQAAPCRVCITRQLFFYQMAASWPPVEIPTPPN